MRSVLVLGITALAGLCAAQEQYHIDPESVPLSSRRYWCDQNVAQCPLICLQQPGVTTRDTETNECDPENLSYTCVCDNGVSPNITQYSQTLPFFICQEWGNQCVKACGGNSKCADACRADHPCGAQEPYKGNATVSSILSSMSAAAATASSAIPVSGFGGATATSKPGTGAAPAAFAPGAGLGLAAVAGSIFFGFALLL